MKKILVICDRDKRYGDKLADYLSHRREINYEIWSFNSIDSLITNIEGKNIDILLIEQELYDEFCGKTQGIFTNVSQTILLTRTKEMEAFVKEESVYKYQSASGILGKLLTECLDYGMSGYEGKYVKESKIIGIYSPIKRALKTTFSYALSQILSEEENTLLINFEGCSGITSLLSIDGTSNLADLLFDYSIYREEYPGRFHEFIQNIDGIGIIPPVETVSELQCVPVDDWISMLRRLKRNGVYENIVIDIGDNVNGIMDILRMCDVIYMPCRDDIISKAKMSSFDTGILKYDSSDDLISKINKLEFPEFTDLGDGLLNVKYSQLGGYVRKIVQRE